MRDHDREVYSKAVQRRVDALEAKKHALQLKVRDIERQIEELLTGQSAIGVGCCIVWTAGKRESRGRVLSIRSGYRGFEYRVVVTTKEGREIGQATIYESHQPMLPVEGD